MPRFFKYMVLLGLIALIAAAVALLRSRPPSTSSIGNTAISHGSPAPTRSDIGTTAAASGQIGLGQQVVMRDAFPLLSAVPDGEMTGSGAPATVTVPAGTVATVVAIAPAVPPDTRQTETYYKVQLPDGQAGWVPEHALRAANAPAANPSPR